MARDLTTATKNALTAETVQPIMLFYADFASGAVRVWSGYGDLSWDSQTWLGVGDFGEVSVVEETEDLRANGVTFTLNGIDSSLISVALTDTYQGRDCALYLGALDLTTGTLITDPYQIFSGRMDVISIDESEETATINLSAESLLIDLNRPRERRYTYEDQIDLYAGDEGLEFVAGIQNKPIPWGVPTPAAGTQTGGATNRTNNRS